MTSPERVKRNQRGEDGSTEPGTRRVVRVVVLHPHAMAPVTMTAA